MPGIIPAYDAGCLIYLTNPAVHPHTVGTISMLDDSQIVLRLGVVGQISYSTIQASGYVFSGSSNASTRTSYPRSRVLHSFVTRITFQPSDDDRCDVYYDFYRPNVVTA